MFWKKEFKLSGKNKNAKFINMYVFIFLEVRRKVDNSNGFKPSKAPLRLFSIKHTFQVQIIIIGFKLLSLSTPKYEKGSLRTPSKSCSESNYEALNGLAIT